MGYGDALRDEVRSDSVTPLIGIFDMCSASLAAQHSNPLSMEFRDIEQSVYCWKSATENRCHRAGRTGDNGVRGGISPTAPYQVPGSASGCWQVKDDSSSRGY